MFLLYDWLLGCVESVSLTTFDSSLATVSLVTVVLVSLVSLYGTALIGSAVEPKTGSPYRPTHKINMTGIKPPINL
ncbi:MAG: hypothetical protein PWQ15_1804 [Methanobacterium sp.]|mgnify:CR=1 FL=1|nr:hypothetical protein [Methanobacterium sp.]